MTVTTKDSYFVLDGGVLDFENFKFGSAFQPQWAISTGDRLFSWLWLTVHLIVQVACPTIKKVSKNLKYANTNGHQQSHQTYYYCCVATAATFRLSASVNCQFSSSAHATFCPQKSSQQKIWGLLQQNFDDAPNANQQYQSIWGITRRIKLKRCTSDTSNDIFILNKNFKEASQSTANNLKNKDFNPFPSSICVCTSLEYSTKNKYKNIN